ncbi:tetratricopeptide repeat protein [Candidatus Uabimicrobium sp. HlEnr_7]|uniref:tetratricopeptide repeat protein n=1 Tax=Candidatus Uabimicrobium helgolandensis TaxID=3095367 RepID=UPI00355789A6
MSFILSRQHKINGYLCDTHHVEFFNNGQIKYCKLAQNTRIDGYTCATELVRFSENGVGVKKDASLAIEYFKKAANLDIAEAMYYLGANLGIAEAMYYLGECYYNGQGVLIDQYEAYFWYKKSLDLGYLDANSKLPKE